MVKLRSKSERWAADATGKIDARLIPLGQRLIDQADLDEHHRDYRLRDILGRNWWPNMIRMASKNPERTQFLWQYLIENRKMPGFYKP